MKINVKYYFLFIVITNIAFAQNQYPTFITHNYIDLHNIEKISRFRSAAGHDYTFGKGEKCSSMKHYFVPTIEQPNIYSPAEGTVIRIRDEWAGQQITIEPDNNPEYNIVIFHVVSLPDLLNKKVKSGEYLGHHIGTQTWSDIAIFYQDRVISYFEVLNENVIAEFLQHNIDPHNMIISREQRNQFPLTPCIPGGDFGHLAKVKNTIPDFEFISSSVRSK